ncbi:MAG: hypothetical protein ACR5K9_01185 [Wolbachia sp.]
MLYFTEEQFGLYNQLQYAIKNKGDVAQVLKRASAHDLGILMGIGYYLYYENVGYNIDLRQDAKIVGNEEGFQTALNVWREKCASARRDKVQFEHRINTGIAFGIIAALAVGIGCGVGTQLPILA